MASGKDWGRQNKVNVPLTMCTAVSTWCYCWWALEQNTVNVWQLSTTVPTCPIVHGHWSKLNTVKY